MFYSIRHITRFIYSASVTESVTEVRMQPRSEGYQRCLKFELATQPRAQILGYRDYLSNLIHYFDIPGRHVQLKITAESTVEVTTPAPLPEQLGDDSWQSLDEAASSGEFWDYLSPSRFAERTGLLDELKSELQIERLGDPLSTMRRLSSTIYESFDYAPQTTSVDSPIDDALRNRQGVCQDFAHIMIALGRQLGIPSRYVSGYLYHEEEGRDRSQERATHAWVEAYLPKLGWIGFDPTNNLVAGERHIRTAVGRDYTDVPPTRGVFKGAAQSELSVSVQVSPSEALPLLEEEPVLMATWSGSLPIEDDQQQQQQHQQQQQ